MTLVVGESVVSPKFQLSESALRTYLHIAVLNHSMIFPYYLAYCPTYSRPASSNCVLACKETSLVQPIAFERALKLAPTCGVTSTGVTDTSMHDMTAA